jgi:hypothetical protein
MGRAAGGQPQPARDAEVLRGSPDPLGQAPPDRLDLGELAGDHRADSRVARLQGLAGRAPGPALDRAD